MISLALILGRPVCNGAGMRIGRVGDIVVRVDGGNEHPPVTGILVRVRGAFAIAQAADVAMSQTEVRLRSDAQMMWRPARGDDDVALARDVLDHQLIDTFGVQVVRAFDVYLLNGPQGWELAGIDVGMRSFDRGLVTRPMARSPTARLIDWAQLHVFVPRFTDTTAVWECSTQTPARPGSSGTSLGSEPPSAGRPNKVPPEKVSRR